MYKRPYKMPDGTFTNDADIYGDAWMDLANSFLEVLGPQWSLDSCDPDLSFSKKLIDPNTNTWTPLDRLNISVELALQLIKKYKT